VKRFLGSRFQLLLILLGGMALRFFRLGADSLWYDETVSTYLAGSPLLELIRHTAGDIHPPLYYVMLRGWLLLMGYGSGRADPAGIGLEFAAGFFSLAFGVALIALAYALARRVADERVAMVAAVAVAVSPYNVWYSQEVRMYTLGAALGVVVVYALLRAVQASDSPPGAKASGVRSGSLLKQADNSQHLRLRRSAAQVQVSSIPNPELRIWWMVYALAAAAGMYTLYYFVFLLIPVNLWVLWRLMTKDEGRKIKKAARSTHHVSRFRPWFRANLLALALYLPWLLIAIRQAIDPPVPPWRTAPALLAAVIESWNALSLGQSAPTWLWPVLALILGIYVLGLIALGASRQRSPAVLLCAATFGPLALILLISPVTPLYHVRYLFTYSAAFYIVAAAGLIWIWDQRRLAAAVIAGCWLIAITVTLLAFWFDPLYRADDHRTAVRDLQSRWRPGDVVLVNAGYAYPPLYTYWNGPIAERSRLTEPLPQPREDGALVAVTTGHVDGAADSGRELGWGDPRSDFFALPAEVAERQLNGLFAAFPRVWHYRIYDTVNDPQGTIRAQLERLARRFEDRAYTGEANMRLQGLAPISGAARPAGRPRAEFAEGLRLWADAPTALVVSGGLVNTVVHWLPTKNVPDFATSVRLVAPDGSSWSQPPDEKPLGPQFPGSQWPLDQIQRQPVALPVPPGTPPGEYAIELIVYDPATGRPWRPQQADGAPARTPNAINVGNVTVARPDEMPGEHVSLAQFGPLALVEASSPARAVSPGGQVPVDLLWQAREAPAEPLVAVVQLLDQNGRVVAGLEAQPLQGRYPTQKWAAGELVRDRHTLSVPGNLAPGIYRLIVGVYRAGDRARLLTRDGLLSRSDFYPIKRIAVQ
jgi:mannosyltransferase